VRSKLSEAAALLRRGHRPALMLTLMGSLVIDHAPSMPIPNIARSIGIAPSLTGIFRVLSRRRTKKIAPLDCLPHDG